MDHPYELSKLDLHLREMIDQVHSDRQQQIFQDMVRLLLTAEQRGKRVTRNRVRLAAERVFVISGAFDDVDVDQCVLSLGS